MGNVRDEERMPVKQFQANEGTIRLIIDYPFDEARPLPGRRRAPRQPDQGPARETRTRWSGCRTSCPTTGIADLSNLIVINYLLERDRLAEVTPNLTADDRYHARTQLDSRRSALTSRLSEALRRAYGVSSPDDADLGAARHRAGHDAGPRPRSAPARRAGDEGRLPPAVLPAA